MLPSLVPGRGTQEEHADLPRRDGQNSSWADVIDKATEINLNIGGLQATFRIGVVILLVLVLCIVFIARWPTSSTPTGSQPSDVPTVDLSDISAVNVSTAEDTKSPDIPVSPNSEIGSEDDSSKTQSAQAISTSSPAIAEFTDGEVSRVLEKAIQDLRYPTDQNETIEELQALNRGLILKAHQEAVEETMQTLKKRVICFIAWVSVAVVIADPILSVLVVGIRGLLRRYGYCDQSTLEIEAVDWLPVLRDQSVLEIEAPRSLLLLRDQSTLEIEAVDSHRVLRRHTISSALCGSISSAFLVRILLQFLYLGSAVYYLCKERQTAGDVTVVAGCGMSLLLSVLSRTSATSIIWRRLSNFFRGLLHVIRGLYEEVDNYFLPAVSRFLNASDLFSLIRCSEDAEQPEP